MGSMPCKVELAVREVILPQGYQLCDPQGPVCISVPGLPYTQYPVQTRQEAGGEATEEQQAKESYLAVSTITHKTQIGGKTPKCPGQYLQRHSLHQVELYLQGGSLTQ